MLACLLHIVSSRNMRFQINPGCATNKVHMKYMGVVKMLGVKLGVALFPGHAEKCGLGMRLSCGSGG